MDTRTVVTDLTAIGASFLCTQYLYNNVKGYFETTLPTWNKIRPSTQNRMSCELALLPIRFVLFVCCAPAILNAFVSKEVWSPLDTERTTLACAIMAGSYSFDLTIERPDVLSLIHHTMGPAMLVWVRYCFATYTPEDALMNRLLISFVFFGAGVGGSVTTLMLILMKLLKSQISPDMLYHSVSLLSWTLTINTYVSTMFGSVYMLSWAPELTEYWGAYCLIPLFLSSFEFYLQWRWALRFQGIADDLRAGTGKSTEVKKAAKISAFNYSFSQKDLGLAIMVFSWGISHVSVYLRAFSIVGPTLI